MIDYFNNSQPKTCKVINFQSQTTFDKLGNKNLQNSLHAPIDSQKVETEQSHRSTEINPPMQINFEVPNPDAHRKRENSKLVTLDRIPSRALTNTKDT